MSPPSVRRTSRWFGDVAFATCEMSKLKIWMHKSLVLHVSHLRTCIADDVLYASEGEAPTSS